LKFDFKRLDHFFSTKSKTIILVSFIIFSVSLIFIYLRYNDEKHFLEEKQAFYIGKIQNIYEESKKSTDTFFINRAHANLNSYGVKEALINHDGATLEKLSRPRWKILKKEHPLLQSMAFYDTQFNLLSLLGLPTTAQMDSLKSDQQEVRTGFSYNNNTLVYNIIVPAFNDKAETMGYIVLSIEPAYFLNEIKKLIGFSGYIIYQNHILENELSKYEPYDSALLSTYLALNNERIDKLIHQGRYFKVHIIKDHNFSQNKVFSILFFQDITQEQVQLKGAMAESFLIASGLWVIILLILNYSFNILIRRLEESHQALMQKEEKLEQLNQNLETKVSLEIEKRMKNEHEIHEKERMLIHQSKLANMGEMIGNIAHQWRQPLTELSSILIAIELFHEHGKLSQEKLKQKIDAGQKQIHFMSKTIEDFLNFFSLGKQKTLYDLEKPVSEALNLTQAALQNHHINVVLHVKHAIQINGYSNEIAQVVLNIISNSKDALIERAIEHPCIWITLTEDEAQGIIEIEDNAQGIFVEPIEKVFEPYFSTKHATSGTGIGLYMCKTIVEKNNHGSLHVSNTEHGALFRIALHKSF